MQVIEVIPLGGIDSTVNRAGNTIRLSMPNVNRLNSVAVVCLMAMTLLPVIASAQTAPAKSSDQWASFRFLLGNWEAVTLSGSAAATSSGKFSFQLEMKDHVLARHSQTNNCKGPTDFDCDHADRLYVYRSSTSQRNEAIYFDTEGHAIHYFVSAPAPNTVVFLSDNLTGPQFRMSYELKDSILYGKFQIRMEGQSVFRSYLEWSGKKL